MKSVSFVIKLCLALFMLTQQAYAFEVSAFIADPVSHVRSISNWPHSFYFNERGDSDSVYYGLGNCVPGNEGRPFENNDADVQVWLSNVRTANQNALQWYEEMGVTKLLVEYDNEDFAELQGHDIQIINNQFPAFGHWYTDAFSRLVQVANSDPAQGWYNPDRQGDSVVVLTKNNVIEALDEASVYRISPSASAGDTICGIHGQWGTIDFGPWSGWWHRGAPYDSGFMAMHFKIRADIEIDSSEIDSEQVATFYWFVQDYTGNWMRFPGIKIRTTDFNPTNTVFDEIEKYIYPRVDSMRSNIPEYYVDSSFVMLDPELDDTVSIRNGYLFEATPGGGGIAKVAFVLTYTGHHTLYLHEVEAWDEGHHRLFRSPDTTAWRDYIADKFSQQMTLDLQRHAGWYYDEFEPSRNAINEQLDNLLMVNKILEGRGLPSIWMNGHPYSPNALRDVLFDKLEEKNTSLNMHLEEFYPYTSATWNVPTSWGKSAIRQMWTDTSSDVPYVSALQVGTITGDWTNCPDEDRTVATYIGSKSLQAALDGEIWGFNQAAYQAGLETCPYTIDDVEEDLVTQLKWVHDRGAKIWTAVQAGVDGDHDLTNCCPNRNPTPNEIKLNAWLSVALDADGIMYYWGMSGIREEGANHAGGLLEWGSDTAHVDYGFDFCVPRSVHRTDRYYAAKEVCNEIHEIAPTLEALDFVKTYASRAFEQNYPLGDSFDPTEADYIYQNSFNNPAEQCWVRDIFSAPNGSWGNFADGSFHWAYPDSQNYVQISRFMTPGVSPIAEDYWFLVVNRRALAAETTEVCLWLDGLQEPYGNYMYERILANEIAIASEGDLADQTDAMIFLSLPPGEAELIHFHRPDTTDLVLTGNQVLEAPKFYNRNIILDGAQVTIKPDTAAQRYRVMRNGQWENQWKDSLEILFAPGKGIKLRGGSASANSLRVLGNDSTQIVMKCAKGGDFKWKGIVSEPSATGSSVSLSHTTISNAVTGLQLTARDGLDSLWACEVIANTCGLFTSGRREVRMVNCEFEKNVWGLFAQSGSIVRANGCDFDDSKYNGLYAVHGSTLDLNAVNVTGSQTALRGTGIRSLASDVWMKCCQVTGNEGNGIEAIAGSLIIADIDTSTARFGANRFADNALTELHLDGPLFVWASDGYNVLGDSEHPADPIWVAHDRLESSDWHNNYWGGDTSAAAIQSHLRPLPDNDTMNVSLFPDVTPALFTEPDFCYLPPRIPTIVPCVNEGVQDELALNLTEAVVSYKNALESSQGSCIKIPAVTRLVSVNFQNGSNPAQTIEYLRSILDTAASKQLRHASKLGAALTYTEGLGDADSAAMMYQELIDSASGDIYQKINGQAGLLLLDLCAEEADTVDGLTSDELTWHLDSLDQILGQRFVWSQYEITDSVVMYAPVRVDSVINIRGDGVLTILPHPGYRNPVVEFADKGAIKVWGTDTTKAKGKLYVYGQPGSRITLHWEDSTGTKNIYSERGFVKVKHARLYGNGFVNQSQDAQGYVNGLRRATFQADSCSFSWFDEGVMARATDTTSYMRACTLAYMGGSAQYSGFGAGLILLRADGFLVEDCVFDGNDGVGIYHALATDVVIRNSQIINGAKVGVFGASSGGGDCRIECSTIASNGDTLPELRTYGVMYDLVGGHNTFSDSLGSLIYATDPSYVDLEEGENSFELLGSGRYLQSGDTNDVWDVTWNTWYPLTPEDSGFYSNLWPTTTSKWTIDSSLANFVSCDMPGASSMGGDSWLIVGDDPVAGTMSTESDDETAAFPLSAQSPNAKSSVSKNALDVSKGGANKAGITKARQEAKAERIAAHHRELAAMRALKKLPAVDRRRLAMMLVKEDRVSEFEPVALGAIARGAVWHDPANTSSKFLLDYGSRGKDRSKRDFAKRLGYQALAQEGHPADAIAGLEELMQNAGSTRDSILALMDAMSIYYEHHNGQALQPLNSQIAVDDPYDLVRRTLFLSELLESGGVSTKDANSAIPTSYALYQNYPNPFNPNTEIRFDLPEAIHAELKVFNILGQEVVTLVDDVRAAGAYLVLWDGKNATGLTVASGVYIYQIKTPNFTDAKKMMLIR